jgi:Peptidase A4 family
MSLSRRAAGALAAATSGALALAVVSAGAAQAAAPAAFDHVPALPHTVHAGTDSNWGGYAVTGGTFTSVTGNWVVPALNCSATSGDISFWSGLDGWTSSSVEQIGLDAVCASGGKIEYNPWVEMYPADSIYFTDTVKAGDEMTSSVTTNGSGSFTLTLADPTQGWTKTYTKTLKSAALSSAEVIDEAIGSQDIPPCPNFGSIQFTDVTANGEAFASAGTVNTTNLERSGTLLTQDGALSGTSFGITWLHK